MIDCGLPAGQAAGDGQSSTPQIEDWLASQRHRWPIVTVVSTSDPAVAVPTPEDEREAFFTVDGDSFVPGPMARGPWGRTLSGHIVGGLLGRTLETVVPDPQLQPARLTVDLLRPILMEPVQVETNVQREGRRITLVDAAIIQHGRVASRASGLFLRRGEEDRKSVV